MDESINKKIAEDLLKSGFASELEALRVLNKNDWAASPGISYFDHELNRAREVDIAAFKTYSHLYQNPTNFIELTYQVLIEVKKSERPWVVLRGPKASAYPTLEADTHGIKIDKHLPKPWNEYKKSFYGRSLSAQKESEYCAFIASLVEYR